MADAAALHGALRIEMAIIDTLRATGIKIAPEAMLWNGGRDLFPTPALVPLEITHPSLPTVTYIFTSEELEAAAYTIPAEVRQHILHITRQYLIPALPLTAANPPPSDD